MKFDVEKLGDEICRQCPQVVFTLLHGSANGGVVRPGGDIDIALYIEGRATLELYGTVIGIVELLVPGVPADVGILNSAEPIYRFEALKGRLLFCRDQEAYLRFFSLTCREYESQMASYERQRRYRLQREGVDLEGRGVTPTQAANLRARLRTFEPDWRRADLNAYDEL
jgi:uncharacterized protein